ncbi:hypothetical protein OR1_02184 [Geobacter sp. OR-1]|uniref:hypothetical protein n=1 Tax=Geobacter sp. OR-1 TaxID=1266765 RepID=UPI0005423CF0|nr:hypothetical protein [Geobacter sp. OR-1]GAM09902.1 hypothetical protein OR1_02184 [Geobacter sp. OR-1]
MEFRLDPAVAYLAVKEPSVHELFRSSKPVVPADRQIAEGATEAYICTEKENSCLKVYLAFWEIPRKTTRIYTPKSQPGDKREYQDCIDSALTYLTGLGYSMDQVNLNYSTAMRQVILGAIKIFKAPKANIKGGAKPKAQESHSSARNVDIPEPVSVEGAQLAATIACNPVVPPSPVEPLPAMNISTDLGLAGLRLELDNARDEANRLCSELNLQLQTHRNDKTVLEAEISVLKERLAKDNRESASEESARLLENERTINRLSEELQELRSLLSARELEISVSGEQLINAANSQRAAEDRFSEKLQAMEAERETHLSELRALEKKVSALDVLQSEACINNEKATRDFERIVSVEKELREKAENELLLLRQEKDQIERVATAALNTAREERKELVGKTDLLEAENMRMQEMLVLQTSALRQTEEKAAAEMQRLKRELLVKEGVAARELAGLRGELRRLIEEQAVMASGCLMIEAPTPGHEELSAAEQLTITDVECYAVIEPEEIRVVDMDTVPGKPMDLPCLPGDSADASPFSLGTDAGDSVTEFTSNNQLATVPCLTPDDLVVLYESSNKVQSAPEGFRSQKSGGYICAIKRGGNPEIFLVWKMLESKQAVLYTPRSQPQDEVSFQRVLQDALFYFDSIGFMMAPVDLNGPVNRSNAINKIRLAA